MSATFPRHGLLATLEYVLAAFDIGLLLGALRGWLPGQSSDNMNTIMAAIFAKMIITALLTQVRVFPLNPMLARLTRCVLFKESAFNAALATHIFRLVVLAYKAEAGVCSVFHHVSTRIYELVKGVYTYCIRVRQLSLHAVI